MVGCVQGGEGSCGGSGRGTRIGDEFDRKGEELLLFWVEFRLVIGGILILFGPAGDSWGSQFSRLEGVQLGKTWNFVVLFIDHSFIHMPCLAY